MLFVKIAWAAHATSIQLPVSTPALVARLQFAGKHSAVIGSCHLAPFTPGASIRLSTIILLLVIGALASCTNLNFTSSIDNALANKANMYETLQL